MAGIFDKSHLSNQTNLVDASLSHRYLLEIEGLDFALIESISRPGYKIDVETFDLMEYKFNFPKKVIYDNTVEMSIVELLDPEIELTQMQNIMSRLIDNSFYSTPSSIRDPKNPFILGAKAQEEASFSGINTLNLSKNALVSAFSRGTNAPMTIHTLDTDGRKYESMRLIGAMITAVKFSGLKSTSSDINKITVTVTFDYADYGRRDNYDDGNLYSQIRNAFPDLTNLATKGKQTKK